MTLAEKQNRVHDLCQRLFATGWGGDHKIAMLCNALYETKFTRHHVKKLRATMVVSKPPVVLEEQEPSLSN
jgi:hypothetical protein